MKGTGKIWIIFDSYSQKQTKPMSTIQAQMILLSLKMKDPNRYFLWTPGWTEWVPAMRFLASEQPYFVAAPSAKPNTHSHDDEPTQKIDIQIEKTITKILHPEFDDEQTESAGFTKVVPSETPKKKPDYGYYHDDFSAEQIDPEAKPKVAIKLPNARHVRPEDRRTNVRHEFKIEVILINKNGRTFRTASENISVGGTLLEQEIPKEFLNTRFDLILINKFEKDPAKGRLHFQGRVVGDYSDPRRLMFLDTDEHTQKRLEEMLRSYIDQGRQLKKKASGG